MNIQVEKIAEIAFRRLEAADGKLDSLTTYDFTKAVAQIKADLEVAKELINLIAGMDSKPKYTTRKWEPTFPTQPTTVSHEDL